MKDNLECAKVLTGHTGSVLCLQYDETHIITGSSDSTVRSAEFMRSLAPELCPCSGGRVVKASDSKSDGVSPRRFESCPLRRIFSFYSFFFFFY